MTLINLTKLFLLIALIIVLSTPVFSQHPKATVFTETFIFDRLFYYFPFGYYSQSPVYDTDRKAHYVI